MAETTAETTTTPPKSNKPVASAVAPFETPKFEMPKFEMPKFDIPSLEVPAAFREFAEKGIAQAKETYEKVKSAAEQATDVLEDTYSTASRGYTDLGLKLIENARANTNAAFDLYGDLLQAKSVAEVVEKSTAYLRAQFESATGQAKELAEHVQKVSTATLQPIQESFSSYGKSNA